MSDHSNSCGCEDRVNHIRCEVSTCAYNDKNKCCTAHMIEVSPDGESSMSCSNTCCRTFKRA